MDVAWLAIAFVLGFVARGVGLPPLVGFLAAGFTLNLLGVEAGEALDEVADLGVQLLLFSIGLKLDLRSLSRPEIWGVASIHLAITTLLFGAGLFLLSLAGLGLVGGLDLPTAALVAFALSFSSTVFAVKALEDSGEMSALHGSVSIGILIVQDIFAIVFLTASTGQLPSPWALALLGLPLLRPPLRWIMDRAGHGELLVLLGIVLVAGAAWLFELVGLKPDLGALIVGVLVGACPKANEMSKALMSFKHLFLVGFFLVIGLLGVPSLEGVGIAVVLAIVVPLKVVLFFLLMTRFRLRARTAVLGSISLATYSEFGLIVAAVGAKSGWISEDWLVVLAIAMSITYAIAAPFNQRARRLYERFCRGLQRFESGERVPGDEVIDPGDARVVIFGMGRIGTGAYDELRQNLGDVLLGVDRDPDCVTQHCDEGRRVRLGDATDVDFFDRLDREHDTVQLVMLTMRSHKENLVAVELLRESGYTGTIGAIAMYQDQVAALREAGVEAAFDLLAEAGSGFAEDAWERLAGSDAAAVAH